MGKSQVKPQFYCENTTIPITGELEMLGVAVDDKMKFERHLANVCRKVSLQANEKDPSILNKKVSMTWIHHSSF